MFGHLVLGRRKHAIEAPQDGEGQDHVGVCAAPIMVADQIGDVPDEFGDFGVIRIDLSPAGRNAGARFYVVVVVYGNSAEKSKSDGAESLALPQPYSSAQGPEPRMISGN